MPTTRHSPLERVGSSRLGRVARRQVKRALGRLSTIATKFWPRLTPDKLLSRMPTAASWSSVLNDLRNRETPRFFFDARQEDEIRSVMVQLPEKTKRAVLNLADGICDNTFRLLGFGPFRFDNEVEWHIDPSTGRGWLNSYFRFLDVGPRRDGADVRVTWELNRFQFATTLGQAYWLTGDRRYAEKFQQLILDWRKRNPCPFGVNWVSPMEAAIRIVNWIWGFYFFRKSLHLHDEFIKDFMVGIYEHASFIESNIENVYGVTTNHTVADYLGLFFVGLLFPEFDRSEQWLKIGGSGLWEELVKQVSVEGVQYESSLHYHAFVAEMFLSAYILARLNGIDIPREVAPRLRAMVEFTFHYTKPDGKAPLVGDSDDGRLVRLEAFADREPADHRWLLAIGGLTFGNDAWVQAAGECLEPLWMLPQEFIRASQRPRNINNIAAHSRCYEKSGFAVMRHEDNFTFVCGEPMGSHGLGNHQHNDWLSFEVALGGYSIICDSGTFVYNKDPRARNRFRSVAAHNTMRLDGRDVARPPEGQLFALIGRVPVKIHRWLCTDDYDLLEVSHEGYSTEGNKIIHTRGFLFVKDPATWLIEDLIEGRGEHCLEWFFHFAPGLDVQLQGSEAIARFGAGNIAALKSLTKLSLPAHVEDSEMSPSYGRLVPIKVLRYSVRDCELPARAVFVLYPIELRHQRVECDLETLVARFNQAARP